MYRTLARRTILNLDCGGEDPDEMVLLVLQQTRVFISIIGVAVCCWDIAHLRRTGDCV